MNSNPFRNGGLPPGVSVSDIPGNRPLDIAFDNYLDEELETCYEQFYEQESDGDDGYIKYFEERDGAFIEYVRDRFESTLDYPEPEEE